jgi:hypothetical protein
MEQFMKLRQEKNPCPPNKGTTRPPAEVTTNEGNTAAKTFNRNSPALWLGVIPIALRRRNGPPRLELSRKCPL